MRFIKKSNFILWQKQTKKQLKKSELLDTNSGVRCKFRTTRKKVKILFISCNSDFFPRNCKKQSLNCDTKDNIFLSCGEKGLPYHSLALYGKEQLGHSVSCFCVDRKKGSRTGFEGHEGELIMTEFAFLNYSFNTCIVLLPDFG